MAYESTTVAVEKSQGEIRGLLTRHGAARFAFGEEVDDAGVRWAAVTFSHAALLVRIRVPHKPIDRRALSTKLQRARSKDARTIELEMNEQEARRIWRVMAWNLKARLISVEEGVETFAEAFLAHIVDPATNRTVYDHLSDTGSIDFGHPIAGLLGVGDVG
jgi:hypothetical protein